MNKERVFVVCECGIKIFGNSEEHAKANLKLHKKSRNHQLQMSGATIVKIEEKKK